ncbi:MarR family winged helix-turn-helix transcriptional regulator [Cellulomonas sp. NPDC055163]
MGSSHTEPVALRSGAKGPAGGAPPEGTARPGARPAAAGMPSAAATGPASHAVFRVARLHRMLAGALLREIGLHPGQELVMMQLWDAGPQRPADLVQALDSDTATMTRTVQRLERAGFVRRTPSPTDRRAVIIEATPASQGLRQKVEQLWGRLEEYTLDGLGDGERAQVLDALAVLERNLDVATSERCACRAVAPRS